MREGNDRSDGDDGAYAGLDEFLCEYVDGTMDAAVRAAFEDYLRLNPSLYEHIECLRETRSMLCRYGCRLRAPAALQERLRERLGEELIGAPPVLPQVTDRLNWMAGVSSLLLLLCGFIAVDYLVKPTTTTLATSRSRSAAVVVQQKSAVASIPGRDVLNPAISLTTTSHLLVRTPYATPAARRTGTDSLSIASRTQRPLLQTAALP